MRVPSGPGQQPNHRCPEEIRGGFVTRDGDEDCGDDDFSSSRPGSDAMKLSRSYLGGATVCG